MFAWLQDLWYNAAYGTLSPSQKDAAVANETASEIQAGADHTTAASVAQQDVTQTLTMFVSPDGSVGADPSQASFFGSAGMKTAEKLIVIGLVIVGGFMFLLSLLKTEAS